MTEPGFTLILPCFNEEGALAPTLESLRLILADCGPYQLIVVDDGSTDDTSRLLAAAQVEDPGVEVVRHRDNLGYGAAIKSGLRRARSERIVITDADGTYPNERLPELLELTSAADMVVGARTSKGASHPWLRRPAKAFLRRLASWVAGRRIPDMNSGLRIFPRAAALRFHRILPDGFSFTTTLTIAMIRSGYRVEFVPVSYSPRVGASKIRPIRDTLRFTMAIVRVGTYTAPLRIFVPIALALGTAWLGSLLYDVLVLDNVTDKTLLLLLLFLNTGLFALVADMIDKRGSP